MENTNIWTEVLKNLEEIIPKAYYNTWLKSTVMVEKTDNVLVVGVMSGYHKNWIADKYQTQIISSVKKIAPEIQKVEYRVGSYTVKQNEPITNKHHTNTTQTPSQQSGDLLNSNLNPTYKFESFIAGKNSALAHAASIAVAESPGTQYNPLFIYGGVGLGKTHLMQAVGHSYLQKNPNANVLYVSCEKFTNDYINAIKTNKFEDFKRRYRKVDMLLIDDIQFIGGKEQTMEEFFHTFNELRDQLKQIILTADRVPKEIPGIEQRLISRFEWGMVVDIQPPNLETRIAIINSKLAKKNAKLKPEVVLFLAEQIQNNVRELEGVLNKILVYQDINKYELDLEQARPILSTLADNKKKSITIKKISSLVAEFYNVTEDDLIKQSRRKEFVVPRQMAMFIIRKELGTSFPVIGDYFGGRDHTTVLHAVEKMEKIFEQDDSVKQQVDLLLTKLHSS